MNALSKITIWGTWIMFFYMVGLSYIAESTLLPFDIRSSLSLISPQGWSFFTKDPQEANVIAYRVTHDNQLELVTIKNNDPQNFFGLSRKNRALHSQLTILFSVIPKEAYNNLIGDVKLFPKSRFFNVKLKGPLKYFPSGKYIIFQQKPIPIEWANDNQSQYCPNITAQINII